MNKIKQYDCFILEKDINPNITKGMEGVVLEIYDNGFYEVEFLKSDGTNYGFDNEFTFTIDKSFIGKITYQAE